MCTNKFAVTLYDVDDLELNKNASTEELYSFIVESCEKRLEKACGNSRDKTEVALEDCRLTLLDPIADLCAAVEVFGKEYKDFSTEEGSKNLWQSDPDVEDCVNTVNFDAEVLLFISLVEPGEDCWCEKELNKEFVLSVPTKCYPK